MRTYTITTRTIPPTETAPKKIRLRSEDGSDTYYPWDHSLDAPEAHEAGALHLATVENHGRTVTVERTTVGAMGYEFRVSVD